MTQQVLATTVPPQRWRVRLSAGEFRRPSRNFIVTSVTLITVVLTVGLEKRTLPGPRSGGAEESLADAFDPEQIAIGHASRRRLLAITLLAHHVPRSSC